MTAYLHSSVALRYILAGETTIRHLLEYPRVISSELMQIECRRVIQQARMQQELSDDGVVEAYRRLDSVLRGIGLGVRLDGATGEYVRQNTVSMR